MRRFVLFCVIVIGVTLMSSCGDESSSIDALKRSKVDALNRESFKFRFDDAMRSGMYATKALEFVNDSLPHYDDGRLRAWNNLATSFSNRAIYDSSWIYVDSVLAFDGKTPNREVEQTLALLLKSRLLQRNCDMAGSYGILYDIERSNIFSDHIDDMLHNLVKSEFYITTTTLNYHYRNKSQYQQAELLTEMERLRPGLRCDYEEDMSFNYALAYGYYALCADTVDPANSLSKALFYCNENLVLLSDSSRFSAYHLGNTYQLLGFMLSTPQIDDMAWKVNEGTLRSIFNSVYDNFGFDLSSHDDPALAFLSEATSLFFLHDDPYQRLGAIVATGRYCMRHGDTAMARDYFREALIDSSLIGVAPKFEAMLYEGFLTSQCTDNLDEVAAWTDHLLRLLNYIRKNEKDDFLLQMRLGEAQHNSVVYRIFALALSLLALLLLATLVVLRHRTKALQVETARLQAAKRKDVERIANVETCLSVMRHDITPFISYLQSPSLSNELKQEVTTQLLRTFENIKNWTNLSIPTGLQFNLSTVSLQEVFESVAISMTSLRDDSVSLVIEPTDVTVRGDRQLIEIMLRNLVGNALRHTKSGQVTVSAEQSADDTRFAHIAVADTGCGMDSDQLEDLFRADKKIRNNGNSDSAASGSGFGLILCRYIIKKHDDNTLRGCRIWAESEPGKGSIFHCVLQNATFND